MKAKHFKLYELLPESEYKDEDHGWEKIDSRQIEVLDWIRGLLGIPLTANTWYNGGNRHWSGGRTPNSPYYTKGSYHSIRPDRPVMATDLVSDKMTADEMRAKIIANASSCPHHIRIERGVNWLHVDVAGNPQSKVTLFNP